jgi:AsmA protein
VAVNLSSGYRLDFDKQKFAFSGVDLKISDPRAGAGGATSAKGSIEVALAPQSIQFDLALDRVNLDPYLGMDKSKPPAAGKAGAPAGGAEEPIDLSALKGSIEGALKIDQFIALQREAEKVNVGVQAASGKVDIQRSRRTSTRKSSGSASVNANTQRFSIKSQPEGVAIGLLLRDALDNDLLEGRAMLRSTSRPAETR